MGSGAKVGSLGPEPIREPTFFGSGAKDGGPGPGESLESFSPGKVCDILENIGASGNSDSRTPAKQFIKIGDPEFFGSGLIDSEPGPLRTEGPGSGSQLPIKIGPGSWFFGRFFNIKFLARVRKREAWGRTTANLWSVSSKGAEKRGMHLVWGG